MTKIQGYNIKHKQILNNIDKAQTKLKPIPIVQCFMEKVKTYSSKV